MPQMDVVQFNNPSNVQLLNAIRAVQSSDYQSRVPAATKATFDDALNSMWNYVPARNQFIDSLVNLIGMQIVRYNTWTNPLAKFKRGMMQMGETLEEIAVGLLLAKSYNPDADYLEQTLFGREPTEVQARWHKINRQDMYKLTLNRNLLRRAFMNPNGLSEFMTAQMASISTSDNWDEFLITSALFKKYYQEDGFYKVNVPDVSNLSIDGTTAQNDAKYILRQARAIAETLPFLSRKYNAAHMPIAAQPSQLEVFITPEAQAVIDVDGLSAAFNIDKANFPARTNVIPHEYIGIPGFQMMISTREFFIILDQFMEMQSANNPAGLYQNSFWHHHQLISASPFVPAILFTSEDASTSITVQHYPITGITPLTLIDIINGDVTVTNGQVARGGAYVVQGTAITNPAGGPNNGLTLSITGNGSARTRITQQGVLAIGLDEPNSSITVHAQSTYDETYYTDTTYTVVGSEVEGSIGQHVDDNTAVINIVDLPVISPETGSQAAGQSFTVDNGKWDTRGLAFAYQWQANGSNVAANGTTNTYTPATADVGKTLTVIVTATKSGFANATATSEGATVTA